jgi:hypothetical protein
VSRIFRETDVHQKYLGRFGLRITLRYMACTMRFWRLDTRLDTKFRDSGLNVENQGVDRYGTSQEDIYL